MKLCEFDSKFFEFNSKQKLLDIMSQHCGPLDEWQAIRAAFAALVWKYVSGSTQRGVTEMKQDWKRDWNRPGI